MRAKDDYFENEVDLTLQEEVLKYSNNFITDLSFDTEVIDKVLSLWEEYQKKHKGLVSKKKEFDDYLETNWTKFQEYFPMDNKELQKNCIQDLISKILYKSRVIKQLQGEFKQ
ncbi:hypothetical protein ACQ5RZ_03980 [Lactobacillus delbrueckii subsp. bulgaricus]